MINIPRMATHRAKIWNSRFYAVQSVHFMADWLKSVWGFFPKFGIIPLFTCYVKEQTALATHFRKSLNIFLACSMCCSRSAQLVIASCWESTCFSICKSLLPERLPLPWFRLAITASNPYTLYTPNSPADMWKKCAFSDTSMKFGTLLGQYPTKTFGYRDIPDSSQSQNGGHFKKWPILCCMRYRVHVDATEFTYWRSIPVVTYRF